MQPTPTKPASLARVRQRAPRYLIGGAWFFIVFTLVHLAWVVGTKWSDPSGLTTLYQTSVMTAGGEETHRALGLAYDGVPGLLLALVQAGVVVAAAVFSTSTIAKRRRIGHAVLVAWAALWMGDLMHLASIDQRLDSIGQATFLAGLFACTVYRAIAPRRRPARPTDLTPVDEARDVLVIVEPVEPEKPLHRGLARLRRVMGDAMKRVRRGGRRADADAHMGAVADAPAAAPSDTDFVARMRERAAPAAAGGVQRARNGARRFTGWLRTKGVIPATGGATGRTTG